jgi:hypothetical protein
VNKTKIAKFIVSSIVGLGTSTITNAIIVNNVQPATNFQKVSVTAASAAIGMMASDATSSYTNAKIDELVNWWDQNITHRSK